MKLEGTIYKYVYKREKFDWLYEKLCEEDEAEACYNSGRQETCRYPAQCIDEHDMWE